MLKTNLNDRVAVITGGGSSLSISLVKAFSSSGAKIALCYLPGTGESDIKKAMQVCETEISAYELEPASRASADKVKDSILSKFGKTDILINDVFTEPETVSRRQFFEIDLDEYDHMVSRYIKGLFYFSKLCSQDMAIRKNGIIVNLVSVRGIVPTENQTAAVAVAGSAIGLSKIWGAELRDSHIRVNAVALGVLEGEPELPCGNEIRFSHAAIKRPCTSDEAAAAALFLASDEASYTTGSVMVVDGGISAGYARSF